MRPSLRELSVEVDTPQFARTLRRLCLLGMGAAIVSELAPYLSPAFPHDLAGSGVVAVTLGLGALLARPTLPRRGLAAVSAVAFTVLGWYMARTLFKSGGIASPHQGAVFAVLVAAHALLPFSVLEFALIAGLFTAAFVATALRAGAIRGDDLMVLLFYLAGALVAAAVGILARTRLQLAEVAARQREERLNRTLRAEVEAQVERIRRAEILGRYLPRELAEAVLAGARGVDLGPAHRDVAVLCAVPAGLLESLAELPASRVAPLVDQFVAAIGRIAPLHGGVVERFVGPRITVLFGALEPLAPADAARHAVELAVALHGEANGLLRRWEGEGLAGIRVRLAVGIASGPAVVGTFGSEWRAEYSAIGAVMTRAHRLAAEAVPGEARLDERVAGELAGVVEVLPGPPMEFTPGVPSPTFVLAPEAVPAAARGSAPAPESGATASPLGLEVTAPAASSDPGGGAWRQALPLPALAEGDLFDGRYRIEERVGRGGMAVVYRARHVSLGQLRAIKLILPERLTGPEAVDQLRAEAEATARIHHANVVSHVDFGRSLEGHYYLALEFVDGPSLAQRLRERGRVAEPEAVRIGAQILDALEAAHRLKIIHRDLKPSNVLLDREGRVRVTDFGLAQPPGSGPRVIAGTPAYMAPEQLRGGLLDERSDLYSFGVTLYELLAGVLPYRAGRDPAAAAAGREDVVPLAARAPAVSAEVRELVDRCLALAPGARPASAAVAREALLRAP